MKYFSRFLKMKTKACSIVIGSSNFANINNKKTNTKVLFKDENEFCFRGSKLINNKKKH